MLYPAAGDYPWFRPPLRVEPLTIDGETSARGIRRGMNWLRGSGFARVHFSSWGAFGDTLVVTIYGSPGTTYRVRFTADKRKRHHPTYGYPSLPFASTKRNEESKLVQACRTTENEYVAHYKKILY